MLVHYLWDPEVGDPSENGIDMGTWLDLSGNPDRPVLRGAVARIFEDEEGTKLSILLADGQDGAEDFQEHLANEGDFAIRISDVQTGTL